MEKGKIPEALQFAINNWPSIVGVILGGVYTVKYGIKVYLRIERIVKFVRQILADIEALKRNILPNGGKSLNDKADKTSVAVTEIQNRMASMMMLSAEPMFECDRNGYCTWVNNALCELFDTTPGKMFGHGWASFLKNRDQALKEWMDGLRGNEEISGNYIIQPGYSRHPDDEVHASYIAHVIRNELGEIVNIIGKVYFKPKK